MPVCVSVWRPEVNLRSHYSSPFYIFYYLTKFLLVICVGGHVCTVGHMWGSEDDLQKLVLSLDHVGSGD